MNAIARLACAAVAASFVLLAGAASADVPGRVGRVTFVEGDVQAYSETDPEWKVAYVNQPITSRNSLFVGDAGRAEVSVGSTTLAMEAGSQVDIQQLDDETFAANVVRGRVSMRIRRVDPGDTYDIAARGADFALLKPGRYRIDALEGASGVTVFAGQASIENERPVVVNAGNAMRVVAESFDADAAYRLEAGAPSSTALDDWVVTREGRFRNGLSERYVSPNMTGYEDLDANGRWSTEADVGPVWYPTTYVQPDWAPYRYGRWAYVAPWGYTWVDDAPWGFAPFHYGRWIQVGNRWGWTPGTYVSRPVYAPALVGFYGGNDFSASFSVGSALAIGWYPLAPWQRYSPHFTQNGGYLNRVNNISLRDAPPRFRGGDGGRDWNRERGGTVAPRDAFASQRSISRVAIPAGRQFDRVGAFNANDLPRPSLIPGAVRRGPQESGRPDFRTPRDFAGRPGGEPRAFDRSSRPNAAVTNGGPNQGGFNRQQNGPDRGQNGAGSANGSFDGRGTNNGTNNGAIGRGSDNGQPGSRRSDDGRPVIVAPMAPVAPAGAIDRSGPSFPQQREYGRPHQNREAPVVPPLPPSPEAGGAPGGVVESPQRYTPRMQAPMRSDGDTRMEPRIEAPRQPIGQPGGERGDRMREMRNMQAPPQNVERPQRVEHAAPAMVAPAPPQAAPMRAAPVAPVAPMAPVAPAAPVAQPAPRVQSPQAPAGAPGDGFRERGQINRDR